MVDCTAIYTLIDDENDLNYGAYQNGDSVVMKSSHKGYCVELNTAKSFDGLQRETTVKNPCLDNSISKLFDSQCPANGRHLQRGCQHLSKRERQNDFLPGQTGKAENSVQDGNGFAGAGHPDSNFRQPEILLFYKSASDSREQYGYFRKTSDLQITTVSRNPKFDNNPFLFQMQSESSVSYFYPLDDGLQPHAGAYEFSVSLEEV